MSLLTIYVYVSSPLHVRRIRRQDMIGCEKCAQRRVAMFILLLNEM
jgi:hypothetical protein